MTKKNIHDIPVSVFVLIFTHFTANEILPLILACKSWERILYGEEYWFAMCEHKMKATLSSGRPETGLRTVLSRMDPRTSYLSTVISQLGISSYRSLFPIFLTELLTGYESANLFTATPPRALVIEQPPVGSVQIPCMLADIQLHLYTNKIIFFFINAILILPILCHCYLYYYSGPLVLGFHLLLELS